jgi:hypothetical protein
MKAAEHGDVSDKDAPSPEQAREYTKKNLGKLRVGKLPEKTSKKG